MSLEYDRNGVPLYDGNPAQWEEYQERVLDLYYGRAGDEARQMVTAVHLRAGLRSIAYEAVRRIPHADLAPSRDGKPSVAGVELLLQTLEQTIAKEKPVRASELFERVLYSRGAHRKRGEAMHVYVMRRRRELEELTKLSSQTSISEDIQAYLLLRFSGLSMQQRAQVISAANNEFTLTAIEKGLRTAFSDFHVNDGKRSVAGGMSAPTGASWSSKAKGKGKVRSRQAFLAEPDEPEFEESEWPPDDGAPSEPDEIEEQGQGDSHFLEEDDLLSAVDPDDLEAVEAYATAVQARQKLKGKAKGKGKTGGGSGGSPASHSTGSPEVTNAELPFRAQGTLQLQHAERAKRLSQLKQKTQCSACGRYGHWAGDGECPRNKEKKKTAYFVMGDDIQEKIAGKEQENQCLMLQGQRRKPGTRAFLCEPCEHVQTQAIQRGANGWERHLQCIPCQAFLCQVPRLQTGRKKADGHGVGLWQYLYLSLLFHGDGACLRKRGLLRVGACSRKADEQRALAHQPYRERRSVKPEASEGALADTGWVDVTMEATPVAEDRAFI